MASAITLPYVTHAFASTSHPLSKPRSGVMFHGGLGRFDFGNRERMRKVMLRISVVAPHVPIDLRIAEFTRVNVTDRRSFDLEAYKRSGYAYQAASICAAPAGDVLSSRRLFDALAAGKVVSSEPGIVHRAPLSSSNVTLNDAE